MFHVQDYSRHFMYFKKVCFKLIYTVIFFIIVTLFGVFCDAYAVYRQYSGLLQYSGIYSFLKLYYSLTEEVE